MIRLYSIPKLSCNANFQYSRVSGSKLPKLSRSVSSSWLWMTSTPDWLSKHLPHLFRFTRLCCRWSLVCNPVKALLRQTHIDRHESSVGKHGLISLLPYTEPIRQALVSLEKTVDVSYIFTGNPMGKTCDGTWLSTNALSSRLLPSTSLHLSLLRSLRLINNSDLWPLPSKLPSPPTKGPQASK